MADRPINRGSLGRERKTVPYKIVVLGDGGVGKSGKSTNHDVRLILSSLCNLLGESSNLLPRPTSLVAYEHSIWCSIASVVTD